MRYDRGDVAALTFSVSDADGAPVDAEEVSLDVEKPDGTHLVRALGGEDGELKRLSIGLYAFDLELDQVGTWPYRFEATGGVEEVKQGDVVVDADVEPEPQSPRLATLSAFRPPTREDGTAWTKARIEGTDAAAGDTGWAVEATKPIEGADPDPTSPALRGFSISTAKRWLRIVWEDGEANKSVPSARIHVNSPQWRPSVAEIAALLRARTYSKGTVDPDNPMAAVAGGELVGEFTEETRPTAADVERQIDQVCADMEGSIGAIPGELIEATRAVAAKKTGAEVERSYIPTESEDSRSIFQTLRMSGEEGLSKLQVSLQWWVLANRPPKTRRWPWWWCW